MADSADGVHFRRSIARVEGKTRLSNDRCLVWLTLPKAHAFNPFLWWFDFALTKRIRLALKQHGAAETEFTAFVDAGS